ncbi:MAG: DNA-binding response regulator [Thermobacillus sp. ZCTH02-B1]|uniref:response regulator transcription factor n=1 Tax=Thermobacillus sp. ZCTH02-B1 TaxID=1858795 RepID=UPI000B553AC0|nr:response regulator transcription factor [Thermobacillus sp. ZCTH02-B1]OUM94678.1 MAG: DNA-binding response regulator [Thermobacillus sp. ZCTH02-B1]
MIRTLVADDDPFIRESLRLILGTMPDIEVAGVCADGGEAVRFVREHPGGVDVVLMDVRMPVCDGVEGTRLIREAAPDVKVLILTTFDDDAYIVKALQYGAAGYLLKNVPPDTIAEGIRAVHAGHTLMHPDVARKLAGMLRPAAGDAPAGRKRLADFGLNETERNIVRKIADGLSNREIAQALYLSEGTVKNYITDILGKLGLRDRTQIAIFYLREIAE